jgi:hypothetical protein
MKRHQRLPDDLGRSATEDDLPVWEFRSVGDRMSMVCQDRAYRTNFEILIISMTSWAAPFTCGHLRLLVGTIGSFEKGELLSKMNDPTGSATDVDVEAKNYRGLHKRSISSKDRLQFWAYWGYYLCIDLDRVSDWELVADGALD